MYARNLGVIDELAAGLTHTDSLAQPPLPGNCMHWVVGHIAVYRNNRLLKMLGQPLVLDEGLFARYGRDSKPVTGDEPGLARFEDLLAAIRAAQTGIETGLRALTPEQAMARREMGIFTMSIAEWTLFLLRH
jgi:DinB superfamily